MESDPGTLLVEKAGMLTLVQDAGRPGYQSFGLPLGGALDRRAAKTANWLVDQNEDAPVLEITLQGPRIRFGNALQIALTGADLEPAIDGKHIRMYETLGVEKGSLLTFGRARRGIRTYLAVRGQWQLPQWLDSHSAVKIGHQAWPPGSIVRPGDAIRILPGSAIPIRSVPEREQPFYGRQLTLRVLPGPEYDWFSEASIHYFFTHPFSLGADCNRMGYRLQEALPDYQSKRELISSGIVPGTIQVLPSGRPVILLADAQTTGGYPRMANILDRDLDDLAQLRPGDGVRFVWAV